MAYIGKQGISSTTLTSKTLSTMVGNGSTDTLTLSPAPDSVNDVAIYLDGVFQTPGTEYTLSGSTITFTTAPANNVFVCALVGGGEHIGTPMDNSIGTDKLVDGTLTNAKIDDVSTSKISGTLPALNANAVTGLNAANLVGSAMPAIDGSNLTGISSFTKNANDPAGNTNGTLGDIWANTTSGELYVLTDATTNANVWTNVGGGTGDVEPFVGMAGTGGSITTDGDYKVHTFNSSGTFEITTLGTDAVVEYLMVGGGGSGGGWHAGGGGAGGVLTATGLGVTATSYTVTVGGGGVAVSGNTDGNDGVDSVLSGTGITTLTAGGGGAGSNNSNNGHVGRATNGNGGGAGLAMVGGAGNGSGFAGGSFTGAYGGPQYGGSGGGGAGAVGQDGTNSQAGDGGAGTASSITGSSVTRAGGGGGCGYASAGGCGAGGSGGGGAGAPSGVTATSGTVNSGGGGGASTHGGTSGAGGSGIVIIRYKFQ